MRSQLCLGLTVVFDRVDLFLILLKQVKGPSTLFFRQYTGVKLKLAGVRMSEEDNPKASVNP